MLLRSYFYREGEVGGLVGTIASVSLDYMDPEHMFLEGDIVSNLYWLGLLCDL